jgi:uncharacterized protein YecE (DUF72 family)
MSKVYVGTSGWMYGDWRGKFYPEDLTQRKWLEYYSQHFRTVEINATFYRQMRESTFENWAKTTPKDFVFAIKASRFITHIKRLRVSKDSLGVFFESVNQLDNKLGPILFQLPPRFKADAKRLEAFLVLCSQLIVHSSKTVNRQLTTDSRMAFEFRDSSWFCESVYQILRKYNAALVIAESCGYWSLKEVITADFTYIRFHGEGGSYASKYTDNELKIWANKIRKWQKSGIEIYAYFNNDVAGFAVENAKSLVDLVS